MNNVSSIFVIFFVITCRLILLHFSDNISWIHEPNPDEIEDIENLNDHEGPVDPEESDGEICEHNGKNVRKRSHNVVTHFPGVKQVAKHAKTRRDC